MVLLLENCFLKSCRYHFQKRGRKLFKMSSLEIRFLLRKLNNFSCILLLKTLTIPCKQYYLYQILNITQLLATMYVTQATLSDFELGKSSL